MGFLNEFLVTDEGRKITKLAKDSCTYNVKYAYWRDSLFERVMKLFVWENTGNLKPKEIEQRLILNGHCGIANYQGELTAFYGSFYGVTKYMDEWTNYIVRCPIYTAEKKIGTEEAGRKVRYDFFEEVLQKTRATVKNFEGLFEIREGNIFIDLKGINKQQLIESGIKSTNIDVCPNCTVCDNNLFFSYRKENATTNRHSAVIKLINK